MLHLKPAVVLALIGAAAIAGCGQKGSHDAAADDAAVASTAAGWEKAYNEKNADAVAALYTEDGQLLPPGPPVVNGRSAIRDFWANDITSGNLSFSITSDASGAGGDWAWRAGSWRGIAADGSTAATGKYVEVWRRTPNGWQLHRDIWNVDEAAPAAAPAEGTSP